jgi:hypothetical protein
MTNLKDEWFHKTVTICHGRLAMMKLFASMTAAAIVVAGVVFIAQGRSEHEAASQVNPLQMMANQQHLSGQRLVDLSLVFEQVADTDDKH